MGGSTQNQRNLFVLNSKSPESKSLQTYKLEQSFATVRLKTQESHQPPRRVAVLKPFSSRNRRVISNIKLFAPSPFGWVASLL